MAAKERKTHKRADEKRLADLFVYHFAIKGRQRVLPDLKSWGTKVDQESVFDARRTEITKNLRLMKSKKIAAAQEELESKAKLFNEQVRLFKSRG